MPRDKRTLSREKYGVLARPGAEIEKRFAIKSINL